MVWVSAAIDNMQTIENCRWCRHLCAFFLCQSLSFSLSGSLSVCLSLFHLCPCSEKLLSECLLSWCVCTNRIIISLSLFAGRPTTLRRTIFPVSPYRRKLTHDQVSGNLSTYFSSTPPFFFAISVRILLPGRQWLIKSRRMEESMWKMPLKEN